MTLRQSLPFFSPGPRLWLVTGLAMVAFAANSILGRAALRPASDGDSLIDPASYTVIRIATGALVLILIEWFRGKLATVARPAREEKKSFWRAARFWLAPSMLVTYAVGFSYAYIGLDTASGTLILFAFVQLTMITIGIMRQERPRGIELVGLGLASGGLVYLVFPNLQSPLLKESLLMAMAGIAWGIYSFLGKLSRDSITNTATNFVLGTPLAVLISACFLTQFSATATGVLLAALSGGIASGLGYVLWYIVLPGLRATQAAAVQLSVPVLAALGGVLLIGDPLNLRIAGAGSMILVGIGLTVKWKKQVAGKPEN